MSYQLASDVIVCNFQKSEAAFLQMPEKNGTRLGKTLLPPVMFLQDDAADEASESDGLFMRSLLSGHIHSLRIED